MLAVGTVPGNDLKIRRFDTLVSDKHVGVVPAREDTEPWVVALDVARAPVDLCWTAYTPSLINAMPTQNRVEEMERRGTQSGTRDGFRCARIQRKTLAHHEVVPEDHIAGLPSGSAQASIRQAHPSEQFGIGTARVCAAVTGAVCAVAAAASCCWCGVPPRACRCPQAGWWGGPVQ